MSEITNDLVDWSWRKARHLLMRAGFGGKPSEVNDFVQRGLTKSVESLWTGPTRSFPVPNWLESDKAIDPRQVRQMDKSEKERFQMVERSHVREMIGSWVRFMITTPTPADMLHQRMMFFWHGHFATSVQKVKMTPFIYSQMKLFYDQALGNYGDLLHAIIRDPAMLHYLDNDQNRKGKPNENLARELMELFTLGTGRYTEKDIQEGARALTGWGTQPFEFRYRPMLHDSGSKQIFGQTGPFDGDDFVNLILQQPACATFMVRKLWTYFASETPTEDIIQELAAKFRNSKYDIKTLLTALFTHPLFYSAEVMASQIKSPVQLIVGTARTLELSAMNMEFYGRMLLMMGQVPYYPPNVKGWPGGQTWIDTSRLVTRYTFAKIVGDGKIPSEIDPRQQGDAGLSENGEMEGQMSEMVERQRERKHAKEGSESSLPRIQKFIKGQGNKSKMMLPPYLKVDFDAEKIVGEGLSSSETVDRITQVLLAIPPSREEREKLISSFKQLLSQKSRKEALRLLIEQVMLFTSYQLC